MSGNQGTCRDKIAPLGVLAQRFVIFLLCPKCQACPGKFEPHGVKEWPMLDRTQPHVSRGLGGDKRWEEKVKSGVEKC